MKTEIDSGTVPKAPLLLTTAAVATLVGCELLSVIGLFALIRRRVVRFKMRSTQKYNVPVVCAAVNTACFIYPRTARCLQRAVTTTFILRFCGIPAEVVIGIQTAPIVGHAWVEVDSIVVNEPPGVRQLYLELDRWPCRLPHAL
jgi:uncharacterized membrane protein